MMIGKWNGFIPSRKQKSESMKIKVNSGDYAEIECECGNSVMVLWNSGGKCEGCGKQYQIVNDVIEV